MGKYSNSEFCDFDLTIDDQWGIIKADEEFFSFLGKRAMYPLAKALHPEDMHVIDDMISNVTRDRKNPVVFRIVNDKSDFLWVVAEYSYAGIRDGHTLIDLHLYNINGLRKSNEDGRKQTEIYRNYLEIMGHMLLSYDIETDIFKVFILNVQEIVYYRGSLEKWRQKKIKDNSIGEESRADFELLYNSIKNNDDSFKYILTMNLTFTSELRNKYSIKGRTVKHEDGKKRVIAVISLIESGADNLSSMGVNRFDMKDAGTELLNKRAITSYAKEVMLSGQYRNLTMAIIDIDNFKNINDTYGHMFGDEVITKVAAAVTEAVGNKGVCGRIGGDEMFVLMEGLDTNDEIRGVLRSIRNNVSWLYHDDPRNIRVTCSIGSSSYPEDGTNYNLLFSIADKMLYLAKEKGRNRYIIFHKDIHEGYINGGKGVINQDDTKFYKYRKVEVVNNILNTYMNGQKEKYKDNYGIIAQAFYIDSIFIYDLDNKTRQVLFGDNKIVDGDIQYFFEDNYLPEFTEEGIKIVDNIYFYERKAPVFFRVFSQLGYNQAVQHLIGGYESTYKIVVSFNRKQQESKWAAMDVSYLTVLANIIGMDYYNGR